MHSKPPLDFSQTTWMNSLISNFPLIFPQSIDNFNQPPHYSHILIFPYFQKPSHSPTKSTPPPTIISPQYSPRCDIPHFKNDSIPSKDENRQCISQLCETNNFHPYLPTHLLRRIRKRRTLNHKQRMTIYLSIYLSTYLPTYTHPRINRTGPKSPPTTDNFAFFHISKYCRSQDPVTPHPTCKSPVQHEWETRQPHQK